MRPAGSLRSLLAVVVAALLAGCIESPQAVIDYQAVAVSDGSGSANVRGWTITLSRADFAFGPVYFCPAAFGSSTLCESSVAEITRVVRVDGLSREPTPLGAVHGFTGSVQSASYDFGISWFDTSTQAVVAPAAPAGHSMRLEGEATRGADRIPLVANVDVVPQFQGQRAVPTQSVCPNEGTSGCPHLDSDRYRLEVHFDAARWFGQLDLDAIAATSERPFVIEPGTKEHNALLVGIKNLSPISFRWVPAPP